MEPTIAYQIREHVYIFYRAFSMPKQCMLNNHIQQFTLIITFYNVLIQKEQYISPDIFVQKDKSIKGMAVHGFFLHSKI